MDNAVKPLVIDYLGITEIIESNSIVEDKFSRLITVCDRIKTCSVKVAKVATNSVQPKDSSYLVSINLRLSEGVELYTLRSPLPFKDSFSIAVADAFAAMYRRLIELQVEEEYSVLV